MGGLGIPLREANATGSGEGEKPAFAKELFTPCGRFGAIAPFAVKLALLQALSAMDLGIV